MDPRISLVLYIHSFLSLGYVCIGMYIEKVKTQKAKRQKSTETH